MKRRAAPSTPTVTEAQAPLSPSPKPSSPALTTPFPYEDYVLTRSSFLTALRGPRFYATLTGASGMGKTSLLRELSTALEPHRYGIVYLSSSRLSVIGVANFLAQMLHISPRRSYLETIHVVTEAIATQSNHLLLWFDEADQVDAPLLQEVRMLAESELATEQLFSVVLSGLPPLLAKLDSPALFPLKRRISMRLSLAGLRQHELDAFLVHRLGSAQAERICAAARKELFERTQATPALITSVARHALAQARGDIDLEVVRAALDTAGL